MPWDQISGNRPNKPQSPNDVASRPLPKSPVSSSLDNVVPQMIIRSPRVRPGKFAFGEAKRLLQHYLPLGDIAQIIRSLRRLGSETTPPVQTSHRAKVTSPEWPLPSPVDVS